MGVIGPLGYRPYAALSGFASRSHSTRRTHGCGCGSPPRSSTGCGSAAASRTTRCAPSTPAPAPAPTSESSATSRSAPTSAAEARRTSTTSARRIPSQWPAARPLERGDVLSCEISASYWDYPGQLLRTFAVGDEPPSLYRELHDVADAAFDALFGRVRPGATAAELVEASALIGDAGFTTRDDLVHGFVGGYLPPVLGDKTRTLEEVPDFTLEEGMTIVIQPNVVTSDESAGVQTGELVVVTAEGAARLHDYERGLLRIG